MYFPFLLPSFFAKRRRGGRARTGTRLRSLCIEELESRLTLSLTVTGLVANQVVDPYTWWPSIALDIHASAPADGNNTLGVYMSYSDWHTSRLEEDGKWLYVGALPYTNDVFGGGGQPLDPPGAYGALFRVPLSGSHDYRADFAFGQLWDTNDGMYLPGIFTHPGTAPYMVAWVTNYSNEPLGEVVESITIPFQIVTEEVDLSFTQRPPLPGWQNPLAVGSLPTFQIRVANQIALPVPNIPVTIGAWGPGSLTGTTTVVSDAEGYATFQNLSIDQPGFYSLNATAPGAWDRHTGVYQLVVPGSVSFTQQPASGAPGVLAPVTVHVVDNIGNPMGGCYANLTLKDVGGVAHPLGGIRGDWTDGQGNMTFNELRYDQSGVDYTLTVTVYVGRGIAPIAPVTSAPFDLTPGSLSFAEQPASGAPGPLAPVQLKFLDHQGQPIADTDVTLILQSAGGAILPLSGTTTVRTGADGIATFDALSYEQAGQGYTLLAGAANVRSVTSQAFDLGNVLSFAKQPASGPIGLLKPVKVRLLDRQEQPVTGVEVTVTLRDAAGAILPLEGTTAVAAGADGIALFDCLSFNEPGQDYTLTVRAEGATDVTSDPFDLARLHTWTGAGDGLNWSDPDNWAEDVAPESGDSLLFPAGGGRGDSHNDLPALTLNTIEVAGDGYFLAGDPITLTGGFILEGGSNTYALDTFLAGTATFDIQAGWLEVQSALSGVGDVIVGSLGQLFLDVTNAYQGQTVLEAGSLLDLATIDALGAGTLVIGAGTAPVVIDASDAGEGAVLANDVTFQVDASLTSLGDLVLGGTVTVSAGLGTVTTYEGYTLEVTGAVRGAGRLRASGAGTMRVIGAVAPGSGLGVNAGTLELGGELQRQDANTAQVHVEGDGATMRLLEGMSGTGGIEVFSGVLTSDVDLSPDDSRGYAGYTGNITLHPAGESASSHAVVKATCGGALGRGMLILASGIGALPELDVSEGGSWVTVDNDLTFRPGAGLTTAGRLVLQGTVTLSFENSVNSNGEGRLQLDNDVQGTGTLKLSGGTTLVQGDVAAESRLSVRSGTLKLDGTLKSTDAGSAQVIVDGGTLQLLPNLAGAASIDVKSGVLTSAQALPGYTGTITLGPNGTARVQASDTLGTGALVMAAGSGQGATIDVSGAPAPVGLDNAIAFQAGASLHVVGGQAPLVLHGTVSLNGEGSLAPDGTADAVELSGIVQGPGTLKATGVGTVKVTGVVPDAVQLIAESGTLALGCELERQDPATSQVVVNGGTLELLSGLTGKGGIDVRVGTLRSDSANHYASVITLEGGTGKGMAGAVVKLGADGALGTAKVIVASGPGDRPVLDASGAGAKVTLTNPVTFQPGAGLAMNGRLKVNGPMTIDGENSIRTPAGGSVELGEDVFSDYTVMGDGMLILWGKGTVTVLGDVRPAISLWVTDGSTLELDGDLRSNPFTKSHVNVEDSTLRLLRHVGGEGTIDLVSGTLVSDSNIRNYSGTITLHREICYDDEDGIGKPIVIKVGADNALGTGRLVEKLQNGDTTPTPILDASGSSTRVILGNSLDIQPRYEPEPWWDAILLGLGDWVEGRTHSPAVHPTFAFSLMTYGDLALTRDVTVAHHPSVLLPAAGSTLELRGTIRTAPDRDLWPSMFLFVDGDGTVTVNDVAEDVTLFVNSGTLEVGGMLRGRIMNGELMMPEVPLGPPETPTLVLLAGASGTGPIDWSNGVLQCDTANNYAGPISLDGVAVEVGADGALGTGALALNSVSLRDDRTGVRETLLTLPNPVTLDGSTRADGKFKFSNSVTLATDGILYVSGLATAVKLAGALAGSGQIVLRDDAILIVAGNNPGYSGTVTLESGTLEVSADHSLGTGPIVGRGRPDVTIQSGPLLGDPILDNPLTVEEGTLTLRGLLTFPNGITVFPGATLDIEGAGTHVVVAGSVLGGGTVIVGEGATLTDNTGPVLGVIGNKTVIRGQALTFTATATDADLPANTLTFSLDAASAGLGMTIDAATGAFSWTPTTAEAPGNYNVTVMVTDNGSPSLSDAETLTIVVVVTWQNPRHPYDVTGDGDIAPIDVLTLINDINSKGSRDLTTASPSTPTPPPFLDPTGDGSIGPVDVLTVINYINAHGSEPIPSASGGEGEYDDRVDPYGREAPKPTAVPDRALGLDSGTSSILASTASSRGQQPAWPASLQPTSGTISKVTRPRTVPDTLLGYELETSELEEAISAISGDVAQAWDLGLRG